LEDESAAFAEGGEAVHFGAGGGGGGGFWLLGFFGHGGGSPCLEAWWPGDSTPG